MALQPLFRYDGQVFGYRMNSSVWNQEGEKIGKVYGNEIYGTDGKYSCDIVDNRVCFNRRKSMWVKSGFHSIKKAVTFRHFQRLSRQPLPPGYKHIDKK